MMETSIEGGVATVDHFNVPNPESYLTLVTARVGSVD